jgi:peptidoglycan/LPS O-acetylase OafA/YrhL
MASPRGDRWPWRRRITRGLRVLGLAAAVVVPFALVVVGFENHRPLLGAAGLLLGAVVVALVVRRSPRDR